MLLPLDKTVSLKIWKSELRTWNPQTFDVLAMECPWDPSVFHIRFACLNDAKRLDRYMMIHVFFKQYL